MTDHAQTANHVTLSARRWFDNDSGSDYARNNEGRIDWLRTTPFVLMHVACLAVFWVGVSPIAVAVAVLLYVVRMLAITGFYHRYFSHKTFKTSRALQFVFAVLGSAAVQRGPLWWAAHHRHHHAHSDQPEDSHSPRQRGFWYSHVAWFMNTENFRTKQRLIRDFSRYPDFNMVDVSHSDQPLTAGVHLEVAPPLAKPRIAILLGPNQELRVQITTPSGTSAVVPASVGRTVSLTELGLDLRLERLVASARPEFGVKHSREGSESGMSYVRLEAEMDGASQSLWLERGSGPREVSMDGGVQLEASFGPKLRTLPFAIALEEFEVIRYPVEALPFVENAGSR